MQTEPTNNITNEQKDKALECFFALIFFKVAFHIFMLESHDFLKKATRKIYMFFKYNCFRMNFFYKYFKNVRVEERYF